MQELRQRLRFDSPFKSLDGRDDACKILVGQKRPFQKPRRRWEDNIKTDLKEAKEHSYPIKGREVLH